MEEKVLLDEDFGKVSFFPEMRVGKILWKRKPDQEEYKKGFNTLLEFSKKESRVDNFLSDIKDQGVVAPDSRKWFENVALPAAHEAGLRRAGVIIDGNIFKRYYVNMILKATNKFGLPLKVFSSEDEAFKWFEKEMDKEPAS